MARKDPDRDKKRRDKVRQKQRYRREHMGLIPKFEINGGEATKSFVATITNGFEQVRKNIRKILDLQEIEAINTSVMQKARLGVRATERLGRAYNKIGDAVYDHVLKSYPIPVGTYRIEPDPYKLGIIDVNCWSFRDSKSRFGTRYFTDQDLIISNDGITGYKSNLKLGYTRHFLERAMERNYTGSPMQRHQCLYKCLTGPVVLVKRGGLYRIHVRSEGKYREVLGKEGCKIDGDIYCCIGYVPDTLDAGFIVAKTLLLPGMRGTPEFRIRKLRDVKHLMDENYLQDVQELGGLALLVSVKQVGPEYRIAEVGAMEGDRIKAKVRTTSSTRIRADVQIMRLEGEEEEGRTDPGPSGRSPRPCYGVQGGHRTEAGVDAGLDHQELPRYPEHGWGHQQHRVGCEQVAQA